MPSQSSTSQRIDDDLSISSPSPRPQSLKVERTDRGGRNQLPAEMVRDCRTVLNLRAGQQADIDYLAEQWGVSVQDAVYAIVETYMVEAGFCGALDQKGAAVLIASTRIVERWGRGHE